MQRLMWLFFIIFSGCGARYSVEAVKERQEALNRIHRKSEGMQKDGTFVACYHMSQMAPGESKQELVGIAEFLASEGFLEAMEASSLRTKATGYENALFGEWACSCFKGWAYVVQK